MMFYIRMGEETVLVRECPICEGWTYHDIDECLCGESQ